MPNDDFYDNLDSYINNASENTDKKLALYISSLTIFRDEEILSLFPDLDQLENLADLIEIVSSTTNQNNKICAFMDNAENLASVAITLLSKITSS